MKALYNSYTKPKGSDTVVPITREIAIQIAQPPEGIERALWLYELCRFLTMKVNNLIIAFFAEDPPCSSQLCPEMRAADWQYLCAVHDPPKSCCAIDYCCHTLDWATNVLTSPKFFPSRLVLGSEIGGGAQASIRHLTNIFRRLYRIFAHAWFQHRNVFWQVEGNEGLYILFKTVCDMYTLIPEENYTVPAEAEGVDAPKPTTPEQPQGRPMVILRKDSESSTAPVSNNVEAPAPATDTNTRRHKHSPSTGSRVTTITEYNEGHHKLPELDETSELGELSSQTPETGDEPINEPSENGTSSETTVQVTETELEPSELEQSGAEQQEESVETVQKEPADALNSESEIVKSEVEEATPSTEYALTETSESESKGEPEMKPESEEQTAEPESSAELESKAESEEAEKAPEVDSTSKAQDPSDSKAESEQEPEPTREESPDCKMESAPEPAAEP